VFQPVPQPVFQPVRRQPAPRQPVFQPALATNRVRLGKLLAKRRSPRKRADVPLKPIVRHCGSGPAHASILGGSAPVHTLELVSAEVCPALVDSALELRASVPATLDTRLTTGAEILTGTHSGAAARRAAVAVSTLGRGSG
jgi:hypothetical protein